MTAVRVSRHQLHWVSRRRGTVDWPFPFRPPEWPWRSTEERAVAEAAVRRELLDSGLLDDRGAVDPLLDAAARLLGGWISSVDCVYHCGSSAVVTVVHADAAQAVRITGADFGGSAPLTLSWANPVDPVPALFTALPEHPPGRGAPVRVPAREGALRATGPTTRRAADERQAARVIAESAVGMGRLGATVRPAPGQPETRCTRLVCFLDSGSVQVGGRYELVHDGKGYATLTPASTQSLAAAARRVLADTRVAA